MICEKRPPIDYERADFTKVLPGGFDVVFDGIGEQGFRRSWSAVRKGGFLSAYGFQLGVQTNASFLTIGSWIARLYLWNALPNGKRAGFYSITSMRKSHSEWFREEDACVTSADCTAPLPWCAVEQNGCNGCFGACGAGPQCNGSNSCVTDADCNASADAKCVCNENNCTICVLALFGGPPGFPEVLADGVWLVGWSGGLDHYSWVQFAFQTATTGTFTLLDPQGVTVTPYFDCEGSGAFTVNLGTGAISLELPVACNASTAYLDFQAFHDPAGFPPHATLGADIVVMGQSIWGFQHPAGFCDAAFTMCGDPFEP